MADERYCFPLPESYSDIEVAPLLCAGLIGYRALVMTGDAERLGLYGFGASAHIIAQVARWQAGASLPSPGPATRKASGSRARSEPGGPGARPRGRPRSSTRRSCSRRSASSCLRRWRRSQKAGSVVCAGIHMSDIPSFPYDLLWGERVAPLGREPHSQGRRGVPAARSEVPVRTEIREFRLDEANEALQHLRAGELNGAAVLKIG